MSAPSWLTASARQELIAPAVDQHRAGAALAAVAALLGAGQVEPLAQQVEQRDARVVERDVAPLAVDGEADGESHAVAPIECYVDEGRSAEDRGAARAARKIRRHPPFCKGDVDDGHGRRP